MQKIASFTIDHSRMHRGIFVSRQDSVGSETVTTFDIRLKLPNREPYLLSPASHTIEHLAATFLRNHTEWKDSIIYWGPMGCLTGFYLIVGGDFTSRDILPLVKETFEFIAGYEGEIPGTRPEDCGTYLLHDLPMARYEAQRFLDNTLCNVTEENLNYPQ